VGLFDESGQLQGVAAWRIHRVSQPVLCRGDIVAVAIGAQRNGFGRLLKEAMLAAARAEGAVAVSSVVHRQNTAMLRLNQQLGTVVEALPDDPDDCLCVFGPLAPAGASSG